MKERTRQRLLKQAARTEIRICDAAGPIYKGRTWVGGMDWHERLTLWGRPNGDIHVVGDRGTDYVSPNVWTLTFWHECPPRPAPKLDEDGNPIYHVPSPVVRGGGYRTDRQEDQAVNLWRERRELTPYATDWNRRLREAGEATEQTF